MDSKAETHISDPIVVTGLGHKILKPHSESSNGNGQIGEEVLSYLKSKKMRKFMGKQDLLSVIASGLAVGESGIDASILKERAGVYLTVGYIPFEHSDIEPLAENSVRDGQFSMEMFSTVGIEQVNPLLTFRCLPNMPIFHASLNLGIQGPYFVTYPGPGQFYIAMEQAISALNCGQIDFALLGAVADQNNFLVNYHFKRLSHCKSWTLSDVGAFLCLERKSFAEKRSAPIRLELLSNEILYKPVPTMQGMKELSENFEIEGEPFLEEGFGYLGPASLPIHLSLALAKGGRGRLNHSLEAMDGIFGSSVWQIT